MIRSPELRQAYDTVRADKARQRKERKAAAIKHVQAWKASTLAQPKAVRERDNVYLAWIRRLPCICCGTTRGVEAMHIRAGYPADGWAPTPMQRKPSDDRTAPGCASCHREGPDAQHRMNERAWWERLGIHPPELCAALRAAFLAGGEGAPVIARFRAMSPTPTHKEETNG